MTQDQPMLLAEPAASPLPDPPAPQQYQASAAYKGKVPIVIDNGASELRAGFASDYDASTSSAPPLHFPPVVARYKDRKRSANILLVGPYVNMDHESKSKARTPNEGGLLVAQDVLENVLDFTFARLGISSANEHPVAMTEPLCNPGYCRGLASELLFEAYGVPSVAYGLDSLFSAYANDIGPDGLVISSGQSSTSLVPLVGGRGVLSSAKRLNWGGSAAADHLLRLLQLKYPAFPLRLSTQQASTLIETPGLFYAHPAGQAGDYAEHTRRLADLKQLQAEGKTIQIPFTVPESRRGRELTEEEKQRREEKKRESGRRLKELAQKNRLQKMMEKEEQLRTFAELKDWKQKERKHEWLNRLESAGFPSEEELIKAEKRIQSALKRSRRRDDNAGDVDADETAEAEVPTFPLIDVPDHELDEDSIREKRRQRLLKAGYDARMRAKAEKREERRLAEERRLKDEEERATNLKEWCKARRQEYEETIERIKERKRKRELLADRKSLAAQQRMKSITSLASDSKGGAAAAGGGADGAGARGKRKRGAAAAGAGGGRSRGEGGDDDFGADDEDWAIYRDIQGAEDSEDEEDDEQLLTTLEAKLLQYDEAFSRADTLAARVARKRALTRTFLGGTPEGEEDIAAAAEEKRKADRAKRAAQAGVDDVDEDEEEAAGDQGDGLVEKLAKQHQITLNVERARLTEVFFQPSMAGVDQAGLDDVSEMIVRGFEDEELRRRMVGNIFLTGRHTSYSGLPDRLRNSLSSLLPASWSGSINVRSAKDPRFDAWRGMAKWAQSDDTAKEAWITRAEYEEMGSEYIKEHRFVSASF